MCNKGVGALEGACPWCKQKGCRMHGTTKYIGAITRTPSDSQHRQHFKEEFKNVDSSSSWKDIKKMHDDRPPGKMTINEAIASGRRMKRAREDDTLTATAVKEKQKQEPFTDVDAFSERFPEWNKLRRTVVDPAHEIMNLIKDILHLSTSSRDSSMAFTKARKEEEQKNGRFIDGQV